MDLLRSLPIGLYLEQPTSWLHRLDPRIKLAWLMSFLITPVLANAEWRIFLVVVLIVLTISARIPLRVWRQQMGWLLFVGGLVFLLTAIAPDGLAVSHQPRLPNMELNFLHPEVVSDSLTLPPATGYEYVLFQQGPVTVNRRSLELAIRVSTLLFTLIYGTNLFLLTTAPEEITAGLESLMSPLRRFNIPVTEIALTLTLSLRFIPLVLEEVQNMVRSIRTRAINWKKLGLRGAAQVWIMIVERILENLLLRAEQIASAMQVRGFTSPNEHRVVWHRLRLKWLDWLAVLGLVLLIGGRFVWGSGV
ncbi:MAG: energy-coupling factor transporter transmembrane component T family protein [Thainema sp.]